MHETLFWQNFRLGQELDIALTFIYDGLLAFDRLEFLNNEAELFKCLYSLSVGFERLLKVGVVLKEFDNSTDFDNSTEIEDFEKSLITHDTSTLFSRLTNNLSVNVGKQKQYKELLSLLSFFYKNSRYSRFVLHNKPNNSEITKLLDFFKKNIKESINYDDLNQAYTSNKKIKKFFNKVVINLTKSIYEIIREKAVNKNIYTHELAHGSKAFQLILYQDFNFYDENIIKKEILLYLLNNIEKSKYKDLLNNIEPLDLDIALLDDYLQSLFGEIKSSVRDEVEYLFESQVSNKKSRLEILAAIGEIGNVIDY